MNTYRPVLLGMAAILIGLQLTFWVDSASNLNKIALTDFPHHYRIGQMLSRGLAAHLYDVAHGTEQLFYDVAVLYLPIVVFLEAALATGRYWVAAFTISVFAAPIWVLLAVKSDQPQAITAIVIALFIVIVATRSRTLYSDRSLPA